MKCHLLQISNIGTLVKNVLGNFGLKISLILSKCYKLVGQIPQENFRLLSKFKILFFFELEYTTLAS